MMEYIFYLNNYYFNAVHGPEEYNERPEPHRMHESTLWTIYQVMRSGDHKLVITNAEKKIIQRIYTSEDFEEWVGNLYPQFVSRLRMPVYTSHPHQGSVLEK